MVDLIDVVLEGFKEVVDWIVGLFMDGLRSGYETLTEEMFGTPTPETDGAFVFGEPSNAPWPSIQDALVGGEIMLISLLLLVMCVQGRHTIRIFNIGSAYEARRTKKTAWVGAFLIISWYWVSILGLYIVDGFTITLMPSLGSLGDAMLNLLEVSITNPGLSLVFALIGGLSMWALEALYYIREVLLYVYVYGMPIAFALAYGNVPVLSDIAMGFSKKFVPLAVLPLPAAVVFKGYDLLYSQNAIAPSSPFLRYLVAASLPLIALYLTWKTFKYARRRFSVVRRKERPSSAVSPLEPTSAAPASRRPRPGGDRRPQRDTLWRRKLQPGARIATKTAGRRRTGGPRTTLEVTNNPCPSTKTQPHGASWISSAKRAASPTSTSRKATSAS
jgi:hypothetical protein